jgi:hypothetical protein
MRTTKSAVHRVVHPQIVADLPDNDLAGVEADADGEPKAVLEPDLIRINPQLLLKVERRVARTLRVVFVALGASNMVLATPAAATTISFDDAMEGGSKLPSMARLVLTILTIFQLVALLEASQRSFSLLQS